MGYKKNIGGPPKGEYLELSPYKSNGVETYWHIAYCIVTKCTKFEPNRPTPISKPAPVSQAEAVKRLSEHCVR